MDLSTLAARVDAVYARSDPASWPDPHADREPSEEEYSRMTHPERYAMVALRAQAWVEVLGSLPGINAEPAVGASLGTGFSGGTRLTSRTPGTLPLLVLERAVQDFDDVPAVHVSVDRPEVEIERVPDCGCDACDYGSANLVEAFDDTVADVLNGLVVLQGDGWRGTWTPDGGGVSGAPGLPELDQVLDWGGRLFAGESVALPEGVNALVNARWL
ncbi:DUF6226 family protein [Promicromonospora thailandica]|nr:DUF6226 family protein [Promicromonospora thailandica]BFF21434.1 hypothetical protein GCM10025730_49550 [Promicromonospora thailandica]